MYLLTKVILAVMLGFIVSALLGLIAVPILKNFKIGQKISTYMNFSHRSKEGTPTMGGLIFIISTILVMAFLLITGRVELTNELMIVMFVFVSYAIIGFIDDFIILLKQTKFRAHISPWAEPCSQSRPMSSRHSA